MMHNPPHTSIGLDAEFGNVCEDIIKHERKQMEALVNGCGFTWAHSQAPPQLAINIVHVEPPKAPAPPPPPPPISLVPGQVPSPVSSPISSAPETILPVKKEQALSSQKKGSSSIYRQCKGRDKLFDEFTSFIYESDATHEPCKGTTDSRRSEFCCSCRRLKRILVNRKMRFNKNPTSMHVAKKYLTPLREQRQTQHYQEELKTARKKIQSAKKRIEAVQALITREYKKGGPLEEVNKLVEHILEDLS